MDPTIRLRIATRIHFALLRHYGEDVAVSALLKGGAESREALWVCEASAHDELKALARQFSAVARHEPAPAPARGAVSQDMAWSQDTSGFGVSHSPELRDLPAAKPALWLNPARWLRGASPR